MPWPATQRDRDAGELHQHLVPKGVAVFVVDLLEPVQVQQGQIEGRFLFQQALQIAAQIAAVIQLGQGVVVGGVL